MHVYQMRSSVPSVVATCQERINICMQALKGVSKVWLVAKMVHALFESILGNKVLEERLQKAAGKRHQRVKHDSGQSSQHASRRPNPLSKRKFDDMDITMPNGGPTPPVSYERSRPETPAATPSRGLGQSTLPLPQGSPTVTKGGLPGTSNSCANTRPTTPFSNPFSLPVTPPALFLVTRTSPNQSPSLWENFQPDQLFLDGTAIFPELTSPQSAAVELQLQMQSQLQAHGLDQRSIVPPQISHRASLPGAPGSAEILSSIRAGIGLQGQQPHQLYGMDAQQPWPMHGLDATVGGAARDHASQDDNWSSSSRSGPTAPTTLNVEDWYVNLRLFEEPALADQLLTRFQFFGINGNFGERAA
jgi:hypothetical protein